VLEELGNAQKVRIGGLVQLTVRVKPAQKKRKGRNPATGEEIDIAAKPATVDVRARPLAKAKAALPSVQKARRRLAASDGRASRYGTGGSTNCPHRRIAGRALRRRSAPGCKPAPKREQSQALATAASWIELRGSSKVC
jgi:hypothetical protein